MACRQSCQHTTLDPHGATVGCLESAEVMVAESESLDGVPFVRYTRYCMAHARAHGYDLRLITSRREFPAYVASGKNLDGSMFESIYRINPQSTRRRHEFEVKAREEAYQCARDQVVSFGAAYVVVAPTDQKLVV